MEPTKRPLKGPHMQNKHLTLTKTEQEIYYQCYHENMSLKQIAELRGIKLENAQKHLRHAREKIGGIK